MTIHKAKGLEFDLVVLADASRTSPQRAQPVYLMEEVGPAAAMDQLDGEPIAYRLARALGGADRLPAGASAGRRAVSGRGGQAAVRGRSPGPGAVDRQRAPEPDPRRS